MSQEKLETARRAWEAANERPKPDFATVNALYHPDHELVAVTDSLEGGTRLGAQGFREWLGEIEHTFESWTSRVEEVKAIDDERVLLLWVGTFMGKQSGAGAEQRGGAVLIFKDGKISRTEVYPSVEGAREAAGLSE